jgi:hypothetical protein
LLPGLRLGGLDLRSLLGGCTILRVDLEEVVDNNENHGHRAKEDGEPVQIVVGNHGDRNV